mgnify:CR=1 FL=1
MNVRVTVWNEYRHERHNEQVRRIYPEGMHTTIAAALRAAGCTVRTATLDEPEHGLSEEVLAATDVLIWWGHLAHREVDDAIVVGSEMCIRDRRCTASPSMCRRLKPWCL